MPGLSDEIERRWLQLERQIEASEKSHRREHENDQKALRLATDGIDRRLDELNQLRKEVVTDRNQFVSASTYKAEHDALKVEVRGKNEATIARIDALEKVIDRFEGSVNTWRGIAAFLGVTGVGAILYAITQVAK